MQQYFSTYLPSIDSFLIVTAMVELLEVGSEAETCLMAGRGMNGLKGIIVCYNPNNGRYTLELEKGDMMSVRMRNVRPIRTGASDDTKENTQSSAETSLPTEHSSSLPNYPKPSQDQTEDAAKGEAGELQEALGVIFKNIPVVPICICIAAVFLHNSSGSIQIPAVDITSFPFVVTFGVLSYLSYEWGTNKGLDRFQWKNVHIRMFLCSIWEIMLILSLLLWCFDVTLYGIIILNVVLFFGWQWGTRNGRDSFDMGNLQNKVQNFSIWEVMFIADLVHQALRVVNNGGRINGRVPQRGWRFW